MARIEINKKKKTVDDAVNNGQVVELGEQEYAATLTTADIIASKSRAINVMFDYNNNWMDYQNDLVAIVKPSDLQDAKQLFKAFNDYLEITYNYGQRPRNQTMFLACGLTPVFFTNVLNGVYDNEELVGVVTFMQQICAASREDMMERGMLNANIGLQWQKLYDGLDIKTEIVNHNVKHDLSKLEDKYNDLIVID